MCQIAKEGGEVGRGGGFEIVAELRFESEHVFIIDNSRAIGSLDLRSGLQ